MTTLPRNRPPPGELQLEELQTSLDVLEKRIEAAEVAKVYQMALNQDDKRAMPTDFIRSPLFAAIQTKDATYVEGEQIASANGLTITYTGQRLTQIHADVWEGIMYLARERRQDEKISFTARQFLRLIGRKTGKGQRDELKSMFRQLTATSVEIVDTRNNRRFWGSLLPQGADIDEMDDTKYVVVINRNLGRLFDRGFATIDWRPRHKLMKKPLALWLQHFLSDEPKPVTVAFLHKHSGSRARSMRHFREGLREALRDLMRVDVLWSWYIDGDDVVHTTTKPNARFPALPGQHPHVDELHCADHARLVANAIRAPLSSK